jgi:anti-sigma-K factor RskA
MKRDEPENLDLLAAEYVIGTLQGAARRSFERRQRRDPFVGRRVAAWEERFAQLSLGLAPVAPSPAVWQAIGQRIGARPQGRWFALAAAAALITVFTFGWIVWQETRPPQATATLASEQGAALWRVELTARGDELEVATVGAVSVPSDRARELWALPEGAAPVSLGLMPATGEIRLALDERQRAALAAATNVAVSDEPTGGSPTGAPTGAVLYVAKIART